MFFRIFSKNYKVNIKIKKKDVLLVYESLKFVENMCIMETFVSCPTLAHVMYSFEKKANNAYGVKKY
jgi:hypothetical protein